MGSLARFLCRGDPCHRYPGGGHGPAIQANIPKEEILENYALVQLREKNEGEEPLSVPDAKSYDDQLEMA